MKFLRAIRFDNSDDHVFARVATADEWCISGGFEFADLDGAELMGKTRQAFANGFLGVPSFGRSTFATVGEMAERDNDHLVGVLAGHFIEVYGAPGREAAMAAAKEELAFIAEMCAEIPINTVFTIRRTMDGGEIREEFREIAPPGEPNHTRIWDVVTDDI